MTPLRAHLSVKGWARKAYLLAQGDNKEACLSQHRYEQRGLPKGSSAKCKLRARALSAFEVQTARWVWESPVKRKQLVPGW